MFEFQDNVMNTIIQKANIESIVNAQQHLTMLRKEHWLSVELFSFQWWLQLALLIIPWVIWWWLVDKERSGKIFAFGLLVLIFTSLMDNVGIELTLWGYPYLLVPYIVRFLAVKFSILPVSYMLIYQYFPKWKPFITANIIFSFVASFIAEPIFVWLNLYQMYKWKYVYSFFIYILLSLFLKYLVEKVFINEDI
ncbi:MAG: CBO0543 family protein [Eubacteriales bacterium]|jgi:hypothetical protein